MLSHDVHEKLRTTGRLLEDLQEVQSMRMSHRPEGPGGPTPEAAIRPSTQEKSIGKYWHCNVETMLQRCVGLKIVVANRLVNITFKLPIIWSRARRARGMRRESEGWG